MARPRKHEVRDRQFNVGLTAHELELLRQRAAAVGMRPVDFGRARLLGEEAVIAAKRVFRPHLDPLLLCELSRLGNNLNQIARSLNTRPGPAPPSLEPLLQEIRAMIARPTRR
jgi:hypothetical protein